MRISNFKIGVRLGAAFTVVVALMIGTAATAIGQLDSSSDKMNEIVGQRYGLIALSNRIKANGYKANGVLSNLLLASTPEQSKRYMDQYDVIRKANTEAYAQFEKLLSSDDGKALFKDQIDARSAYGVNVRKFFDLVRDQKTQEARDLYQGDMATSQDQYYILVDKMVDHQVEQMQRAVSDASDAASRAKLEMLALAAIAALIAIATAVTATRSITEPIGRAVRLAEAVAQGDLRHRPSSESNDEVGRLLVALDHMVDKLHGIVGSVRNGTDAIASASGDLASGNTDLSMRTERQASSLEETAAAMEQFTSAVKQNAENARVANQLAANASVVAARGGDAVDQVVHTMSTINESSRRIVDITSVIDGIAFQTNILALNAAVEAARAGEHGRGFAVVASEVRALAQRSATAAKEIKTLIDESVEQVGAGGKMVEEAGRVIREVVTGIKQVADIVAEISSSSQEQSDGIGQVSTAISQMDKATQENAVMVEEGVAAAQSLRNAADELTATVSTFQLDGQPAMRRPRLAADATHRHAFAG